MAALSDARHRALELRKRLHGEGRFGEAMCCLMLASDASFLTEGPVEAGAILATINSKELEASEAPAVIGDAAIRVQAPLLALAVTAGAEDSAEVRRIRATARTRLEAVGEELVLEACTELDGMVGEPGLEGEVAAIMRVLACLHNAAAPWSETAAARLVRPHLKEAAVSVAAMVAARRSGLPAADAISEKAQFSSPRVRAECRFQSALEAEETDAAADRARDLLAVGTDQINRGQCAGALQKAGDVERAVAEARGLLDDARTPRFVRADMHALMVEVALEADDLDNAAAAAAEWVAEFPGDDRANWLTVSIASRRSKQHS
jgi:hypothetical protein